MLVPVCWMFSLTLCCMSSHMYRLLYQLLTHLPKLLETILLHVLTFTQWSTLDEKIKSTLFRIQSFQRFSEWTGKPESQKAKFLAVNDLLQAQKFLASQFIQLHSFPNSRTKWNVFIRLVMCWILFHPDVTFTVDWVFTVKYLSKPWGSLIHKHTGPCVPQPWTLTAELQKRMQAMEVSCYGKILCISYKDSVTKEEVHAQIQQAIGAHGRPGHRKEMQNCSGMDMFPVLQV